MTISEACGHHCGSQNSAERHCDCTECHNGTAPVVVTRGSLLSLPGGVPMCEKWAARSRQWDSDHPAEMSPEERRDFEDEQIRGCRP